MYPSLSLGYSLYRNMPTYGSFIKFLFPRGQSSPLWANLCCWKPASGRAFLCLRSTWEKINQFVASVSRCSLFLVQGEVGTDSHCLVSNLFDVSSSSTVEEMTRWFAVTWSQSYDLWIYNYNRHCARKWTGANPTTFQITTTTPVLYTVG
jgi:hypothetical protein